MLMRPQAACPLRPITNGPGATRGGGVARVDAAIARILRELDLLRAEAAIVDAATRLAPERGRWSPPTTRQVINPAASAKACQQRPHQRPDAFTLPSPDQLIDRLPQPV